METQKNNPSTSFMRGWRNVPQGKVKEVRAELMKLFGVTSDPAWRQRLYGRKELTVSEYEAVKQIFKRYGITDVFSI